MILLCYHVLSQPSRFCFSNPIIRPSLCAVSPILTDIDGVIQCVGDSSCCDCELIECTQCETVFCEGMDSCRGTNISVNGNPNGASIVCGGPRACQDSNIIGNNIASIQCVGFDGFGRSCQGVNIAITNGIDLMIDIGRTAGRDSVISADNVMSINCAGCGSSNFDIICLDEGCDVVCNQASACVEAEWNIVNVNSIDCTDSAACQSSRFDIICTSMGCPINCIDSRSCEAVIYNIENSFGLFCGEFSSCGSRSIFINSTRIRIGAVFNLVNNVGGTLACNEDVACSDITVGLLSNIDAIICNGFNTCQNGNINATCNVETGCDILCQGGSFACDNATITSTDVNNILCNGGGSVCEDTTMNITPFDNSFQISITGIASARNAIFNTQILRNDITNIQGISCTLTSRPEVGVCVNTIFNIDAGTLSNPVTIDSIACTGTNSCLNATFTLINAQINEANFFCDPLDACTNTAIICQSINGTILPMESCVIPEII